jgi:hypothetical protein
MRELLAVQRAPFQVSKLARTPLNQLELLPAASGVYLGIDDANRVWYVGLAGSLRDRLRAHERMSDFRTRSVTVIAWKEFEEERCYEVETAAIQFFGPPLLLLALLPWKPTKCCAILANHVRQLCAEIGGVFSFVPRVSLLPIALPEW